MSRPHRILFFRDSSTLALDEPGDLTGVLVFDQGGDIVDHLSGDAYTRYDFALLLAPDGSEQLVARRRNNEELDPSVVLSRIFKEPEVAAAELAEDERAWKRYCEEDL